MIIKASEVKPIGSSYTLSIRCPGCGFQGTFEHVGISDLRVPPYDVGIRRCPNDSCRTLVYHIHKIQDGVLVATFPPMRIDFDRSSIPENVLAALEEAIACHANYCFVASAIMVRKALNLLCVERGATGPNLKERIASLGGKVLIPKEMLDGMESLRLLGRDAAQVESSILDDVGKEEAEVSIEFAKQIIKAAYQSANLLAKINSLKKTP